MQQVLAEARTRGRAKADRAKAIAAKLMRLDPGSIAGEDWRAIHGEPIDKDPELAQLIKAEVARLKQEAQAKAAREKGGPRGGHE